MEINCYKPVIVVRPPNRPHKCAQRKQIPWVPTLIIILLTVTIIKQDCFRYCFKFNSKEFRNKEFTTEKQLNSKIFLFIIDAVWDLIIKETNAYASAQSEIKKFWFSGLADQDNGLT